MKLTREVLAKIKAARADALKSPGRHALSMAEEHEALLMTEHSDALIEAAEAALDAAACPTCGGPRTTKCSCCQSEEKFYTTGYSRHVDLMLQGPEKVNKVTLMGRGVKFQIRFGTNETDDRGETMTKTREVMLPWDVAVDAIHLSTLLKSIICDRFARDIADEIALAKKLGGA